MARLILVAWLLSTACVYAKDLGQWGDVDKTIRQWYQALMQPDNPGVSCCGEADAYWCDSIHVKDVPNESDGGATSTKRTFCTVTDDRDDGPLRRKHVPVGTEVLIPDYKLTWKDGNPTGHSILFLSRGDYVYCFVQNGGV